MPPKLNKADKRLFEKELERTALLMEKADSFVHKAILTISTGFFALILSNIEKVEMDQVFLVGSGLIFTSLASTLVGYWISGLTYKNILDEVMRIYHYAMNPEKVTKKIIENLGKSENTTKGITKIVGSVVVTLNTISVFSLIGGLLLIFLSLLGCVDTIQIFRFCE